MSAGGKVCIRHVKLRQVPNKAPFSIDFEQTNTFIKFLLVQQKIIGKMPSINRGSVAQLVRAPR